MHPKGLGMALYMRTVSLHPPSFSSSSSTPSPILRHKHLYQLCTFCPLQTPSSVSSSSSTSSSSSSFRALAQTEKADGEVAEVDPPSSVSGFPSSARAQLDLLEQLTAPSAGTALNGYESDGSSSGLTIREQLARLFGDREGDFSIPLGKKNLKKMSEKFLTISQKRNIRRQAYLNEVSQRNDSVFFATIGAFVILPPVVILGIAILTGYVQLFP